MAKRKKTSAIRGPEIKTNRNSSSLSHANSSKTITSSSSPKSTSSARHSATGKNHTTTAIIPCFRTGSTISDVVHGVKQHVDSVIVIDDGSDDNTAEVARMAGATVIVHPRNMGKGAGMLTGASNTDSDILIFIDGDGQNDPDDIPRLIAPLLSDGTDLVIGSRHLKDSKVSSPAFTRRFTNILASLVISGIISFVVPPVNVIHDLFRKDKIRGKARSGKVKKISGNHYVTGTVKWITDCTSGFRAMKMDVWNDLGLTATGFEIETEMIFEAARQYKSMAEVPISCTWQSGISSLAVIKDGTKTLKLLVRKFFKAF